MSLSNFIELRHGFWKKRFIKLPPEFKGGFVFEPKQEIAQCSICGCKFAVGNDSVMFSFCPGCGGKMDEIEQAIKEE